MTMTEAVQRSAVHKSQTQLTHRQPTRHCSRVAMPVTNRTVLMILLMASQSWGTHSTNETTNGNTTRLLSTVT